MDKMWLAFICALLAQITFSDCLAVDKPDVFRLGRRFFVRQADAGTQPPQVAVPRGPSAPDHDVTDDIITPYPPFDDPTAKVHLVTPDGSETRWSQQDGGRDAGFRHTSLTPRPAGSVEQLAEAQNRDGLERLVTTDDVITLYPPPSAGSVVSTLEPEGVSDQDGSAARGADGEILQASESGDDVSLLIPDLKAAKGNGNDATVGPGALDVTTSKPDLSTSEPDLSTAEPELSTSEPDLTTSEPDLSTSEPDLSTLEPDLSKLEPDLSTSEPDLSKSEPDLSTSEPDLSTLEPDLSTSEPDLSKSEPDLSTSEPGAGTTLGRGRQLQSRVQKAVADSVTWADDVIAGTVKALPAL